MFCKEIVSHILSPSCSLIHIHSYLAAVLSDAKIKSPGYCTNMRHVTKKVYPSHPTCHLLTLAVITLCRVCVKYEVCVSVLIFDRNESR